MSTLKRARRARIVATLGPATSGDAPIRALFETGVDVFRLNFSHGSQADHAQRLQSIRRLEAECGRPIGWPGRANQADHNSRGEQGGQRDRAVWLNKCSAFERCEIGCSDRWPRIGQLPAE